MLSIVILPGVILRSEQTVMTLSQIEEASQWGRGG
jgi:hypothetical protein